MFAKGIPLPTLHVICLRGFIGAVGLWAFLLLMKTPILPVKRSHFGALILMGAFMCLHWLTYFAALKISTAAVAMLSLQTYPIFAAIIEPLIYREKIKRMDLVMVVGVFAGVLIMTPEFDLSNRTTQGILFGVVSGLLFTGRNLWTRKYIKVYSGSTLMFWQTLVTGVLLLPLLFVSEEVDYSSKNMGLVALLAIVFTAFPQVLFSASLKNLRVTTVSVLATLLPFYGAILGFLFYKEVVTGRTALGGAFILSCVLLETLRNMKTDASGVRS